MVKHIIEHDLLPKLSNIIFSLEILLINNHFIYLLFSRSHIPSKVKSNLNLKSGMAAFFTDLATYRSNNPSSSSYLSLKQNLKSTQTVLSSIPTPVICTTSSAKHNREIMLQNNTFQHQVNENNVPSQAFPFRQELKSSMLTDVTINQSESLGKEDRALRRSLQDKVKHHDIFLKLQPPPKVSKLTNPFSDGFHFTQGSESRWTGKSSRGRIYNNPSVKCSSRAYQKTPTVIRSPIDNSSIPSSTLTSKDLSNR